jgi:uncharacterized repeat protein (TIGR01451 family)
MGMARAFVVSEVRTLIKFAAAVTVALLALGLWPVSAWAQDPAPDLSITKDGPARVEPEDVFIYTLVVRNTGDAEATAVVVTDRLPEGVDFLESEPDICEGTPDPTNPARERVTCEIETLAAGASRTIELTVRAPIAAGVIENRANVASEGTEPENSNTVTTRVIPDLVIRKSDDPDPVTVEDLLLYTLRVTNQGARDVENVVVIDDLPTDEVDLVRVESDDFECEENAGLVRCEGRLPEGDTGTVRILVEPEVAGTIENTAEVRAGRVRVDRDTERTTVEDEAEPTEPPEPTETTNTTTDTTAGTTDGKTTDEQTTVIDGQTIIVPKAVAADELPETGGPTGGGYLLAAGCALLGVGLILNRIVR